MTADPPGAATATAGQAAGEVAVMLDATRGFRLTADDWTIAESGLLTVTRNRRVVAEFAPGCWVGVADKDHAVAGDWHAVDSASASPDTAAGRDGAT